MDQQLSFAFASFETELPVPAERDSEEEINRKLRYMQSLPQDDPNKHILANDILQWILTR